MPILDFVHAVTSAYAAATAGRPRSEGWPVDPRYRRLGRPVTSSRVESTVEQLDRRVKGRERFWSKRGRVALR